MKNTSYTLTGTPQELLQSLDQFKQSDDTAEAKLKTANHFGCGSLLMGVLCCFLFAYQFETLALVGLVFAGLMFVAFLALKLKYSDMDLEDRKLDLARATLETLSHDLLPNKTHELQLDLRDSYNRCFRKGVKGGIFEAKTHIFVQPWFNLKGRLANGNGLTLTLRRVGAYKVKGKWRVKSGKIKYKSKCKHRLHEQVEVQVVGLSVEGITQAAGQPPGLLTLAQCQEKADRIKAKLTVGPQASVTGSRVAARQLPWQLGQDEVLAGLVWLFRGIARASQPG